MSHYLQYGTFKIRISAVVTIENLNVLVNRPQFIVGEDGTCGLVYEHAPAEGPPIVFLIDYVVKYMYVSLHSYVRLFPAFK